MLKWKLIYWVLKIIGYRRKVIINNLQSRISPSLSDKQLISGYQNNLKYLSRIITESTWKLPKSTLNSCRQNKGIHFSGIQKMEASCISKNGLILFAAHYGNWELACTLLPLHTSLPVYGVYKPLKNKMVDKWILSHRSRHGLHLVPMNKIARIAAENVVTNKPAIYILIADQNPKSKSNIIWEDFLGVKTAYNNGGQKLAEKYGFGVGYMSITPEDELYKYTIEIDLDFDLNANLIHQYSQKLESQIKNNKDYWLWSHKRWKRKYG